MEVHPAPVVQSTNSFLHYVVVFSYGVTGGIHFSELRGKEKNMSSLKVRNFKVVIHLLFITYFVISEILASSFTPSMVAHRNAAFHPNDRVP